MTVAKKQSSQFYFLFFNGSFNCRHNFQFQKWDSGALRNAIPFIYGNHRDFVPLKLYLFLGTIMILCQKDLPPRKMASPKGNASTVEKMITRRRIVLVKQARYTIFFYD